MINKSIIHGVVLGDHISSPTPELATYTRERYIDPTGKSDASSTLATRSPTWVLPVSSRSRTPPGRIPDDVSTNPGGTCPHVAIEPTGNVSRSLGYVEERRLAREGR